MKSQEIYSHRMDQFGSVNEEDSSTVERLRDQRIKRGECPTCQRKTHKISRFRGKREPLTIEGEVVNGICLHCNPLTKSSATSPTKSRSQAPVPVPDTFECDDDFTVASEITLDTTIQQQANAAKRSTRYFESVSEETPMTEFRKRDNGDQIPTNIIGAQRGRSKMSRLVEEDDDEDEKWEKQQRRQKFHPMSREMYLFNSERSLGIESTGTDGSENSSEHFRPPTLHPLSKYIYNSERSLPVSTNESESSDPNKFCKQQSDRSLATDSQNISSNDSDKGGNPRTIPMKREQSTNSLLSSESGYSSDGQRIKSLLQGSQSIKTKVCENLTLPKSHNQGGKDDSLQQKRDHQHIKSDSFKPSPVKPASSENRRPNRFSLRQVEQNRFSLTLKDLPRAKLRASDPTDYNYEMELDNSRNWDSADILRDAAAEANGEKFSLDDFIKEMEAEKEQLANSKQRPDDNLPHVAATETTSSTDKLEAMFSSLSLPPSPADEAK